MEARNIPAGDAATQAAIQARRQQIEFEFQRKMTEAQLRAQTRETRPAGAGTVLSGPGFAQKFPPQFLRPSAGDPGFIGAGIQFFQRGGVVRRPTLAVLGEHGAEAVVPLDGEVIGAPINVSVVMNGMLSADDPQTRAAIRRLVSQAVMDGMSRQRKFDSA